MLCKQLKVSRALTLIKRVAYNYCHVRHSLINRPEMFRFISKYILSVQNVFKHVPHQNMNVALTNVFFVDVASNALITLMKEN